MNCHFNREDYDSPDSPSSFGVSRKQNQANPYHFCKKSAPQISPKDTILKKRFSPFKLFCRVALES